MKKIKIIDPTYITRLNQLNKAYEDGQKVIKGCEDSWEHLLDMETVNIDKLNDFRDKMDSVEQNMSIIKNEINRITLELSN